MWTLLALHRLSIQVLSMEEKINLNDVIHFWMRNALSQKLIFAYQWLAFTEYPLNATFTYRKSQTPKACSYWTTVLSVILTSLPFQKTECTYAKTMTTKSSQFHGSRRKVNSPTQKPLARILTSDSKVYIPVKVYLDTRIRWDIKYEEYSTM